MKRTRTFKGYYKFMKGYEKYLNTEFKSELGNKPKLRIRQLGKWYSGKQR